MVRSQIRYWEVKQLQLLHNLRIDPVTIQSEHHISIVAKVVGAVKWISGPVPTLPKGHSCMSGPGLNPLLGTLSGPLGVCDLDRNQVTRNRC